MKSTPYTVREQSEHVSRVKDLLTNYFEERPVIGEIVAVYVFIIR